MTEFDFRLRFHLSQNTRINFDLEEYVIYEEPCGEKIRIRSGGLGKPIKDFSDAAIIGGPYASPEQAKAAAERIRAALLVWAIRQKIGIDLGEGRLRGGLFPAGIKMFEEMYKRPVRNDLHGIDIYEHKDNIIFARMALTCTLGKDSANFSKELIETYKKGILLTEKQLLAAELYCASFFDFSFRSRLVTLVTAIEAMIDLAERPKMATDIVVDMENQVKSSYLSRETKDSLLGGLQWLRYESIRQSGRKLVARYLGDADYAGASAIQFFNSCYDLRSQILHNGKPDDESIDLPNVTNALSMLVSNLLISSFGLPVV